MTLAQITAILSLLLAFGVNVPTVNNVRAILTATESTSTPISTVQTVISPVVENQPVYFGSTNPVIPTPPPQVQTPVVESVVMNPPQIEAITIDQGTLHINSFDALNLAATILPKGVTMGNVDWNDRTTLINRNGNLSRDGHGYGVVLNGLPPGYLEVPDGQQANIIDITLVGTNGGQTTKSVIVR